MGTAAEVSQKVSLGSLDISPRILSKIFPEISTENFPRTD